MTAAAPAASGIASPRSVVFAYSPASLSLRRTATHFVERLAGDESRRADALAVPLHEALEPGALRRVEDGCARNAATVFRAGSHVETTLPDTAGNGRLRRSRLRDQLRDGSGGIAARTPNGPPLRRSTPLQSSSGSSVKTSSASAGLDDPGTLVELVVELAGPPARIADVDTRAAQRSESRRVDLGGQEPDGLDDERIRVRRLGEVGEHDDR